MSDAINKTQDDEAKDLVSYFERGCVCLLTDKFKKSDSKNPVVAADYYMENCKCSRHPESATRYCWDKNLGAIDKAALRTLIAEGANSFDADSKAYT